MTAVVQEWVVENVAWASAQPRLSVLIPFLNDNPCDLIAALDREAKALGGAVEVVLLDDGSGNDDLAGDVVGAIEDAGMPARHVRLVANEGRSKGRNRLARNARAPHLLFLDSDMLPDAPDFLGRYLALIDNDNPAVVVGGFSLEQAPERPEHRLHRKLAERSDCAPACERRKMPEKYVFTSNLLIRRDVFQDEAFDEAFVGWGWEDVEWGVRISRKHPIQHVDNAATHLGLDPAPIIAIKYEQSGANFARILRAHPDVVCDYPTYRAAKVLKRAPLRSLWRPMLKALAITEGAPIGLRAIAMRLYRIAACVEAI